MMTPEAEVEPVTISPKFQVVIPKKIREAMALRPGQRLLAVQVGDRIELVPLPDAKSQRGSLRGIDTDVAREDDRV